VVAGRHARHALAGIEDDGRPLVAEHRREPQGRLALHEVKVAAADARGRDPHVHLVGLGRIEGDVLDRHRLVGLAEDGGSHGIALLSPLRHPERSEGSLG